MADQTLALTRTRMERLVDEEVAVGAEDLAAVRALVNARVSPVRRHPSDARETGLRPDRFELQLKKKDQSK